MNKFSSITTAFEGNGIVDEYKTQLKEYLDKKEDEVITANEELGRE